MAPFIRQGTPGDLESVYSVIEEASRRYKGVIPGDRWKEPYMPRDELVHEIKDGVEFWVIGDEEGISGVMGLQDKGDVQLIRHAYVLTRSQGRGAGSALLHHIYALTSLPVLVGTWKAADWAIRFYEKHGFREVDTVTKDFLLNKYWDIPARQTQTSTVLADRRWFQTNT
jgi:N-acetylglutamate synthase-like GNAT family acetyltransferase